MNQAKGIDPAEEIEGELPVFPIRPAVIGYNLCGKHPF
jgi:hypothetical protein